jgi:hypothetical protein
MKEANHGDLDMVQFESDTLMLTEAIRTNHSGNSKKFSLIVTSITHIMLSCENFEVKFARKQADIIAYIILLGRQIIGLISLYLNLIPYVLIVY